MLKNKDKIMVMAVFSFAAFTLVACDDGDGDDGSTPEGYEFFPEGIPSLEPMSPKASIEGFEGPAQLETPELEPELSVYTQVSPLEDQIVAYKAVTPVPAIVVIRGYELGAASGAPTDEILGYSIVEPGVTYNVEVDLNRPFEHKEVLWAGLFEDLGQAGVFEPSEDPIFQREWGSDLAMAFTAYTHMPVSEFLFAQDQSVDGSLDEVSVLSVASDEEGWVAVYEDDNGAPGTLLGKTAVPHEYSNDVEVLLNRQVVDGEELWAVLHDDLGVVGVWEPLVDLQAEEPCPGVTAVTFSVSVL